MPSVHTHVTSEYEQQLFQHSGSEFEISRVAMPIVLSLPSTHIPPSNPAIASLISMPTTPVTYLLPAQLAQFSLLVLDWSGALLCGDATELQPTADDVPLVTARTVQDNQSNFSRKTHALPLGTDCCRI